ncbi:MAG: hypothetical protein MZV63_64910 [Marinilabiliales bacterium]|nr:hypothetical protein [Marinilabiliales bacterium]
MPQARPAGSGLREATIRSAAERLGAALLGNIRKDLFQDASQNRGLECSATILQVRSEDSTPRSRKLPSPVFGTAKSPQCSLRRHPSAQIFRGYQEALREDPKSL